MNNSLKLSLAVATILMASTVAFPSRPSFECTSSEDCGMDECCVLGMMRYSEPVCKPMGNEGQTCRPRFDDAPQNVSVSYPDGSYAQLNVHMVVCPCASGLVCTDDMACAGLDGAGKLVLREDYTDVDELNQLRR